MGTKVIDLLPAKQDNSIIHAMKNVIFDAPQAVYSELADIRAVASQANMMCCPIEYFDMDSALKPEMFGLFDSKQDVVNSILNFQKYFEEKANIYVLCPIQFYDANKHVKSKIDKDIFAPKYEQAFFAINALVPTLRNIDARLTNLETMQKQLQKMAERQIRLDDPMIFAIPRNTSIFDNAKALLGTCWGKDISNDVLQSLNLQNLGHKINELIIKSYMRLNVSAVYNQKQIELENLNKRYATNELINTSLSSIAIRDKIEKLFSDIYYCLGVAFNRDEISFNMHTHLAEAFREPDGWIRTAELLSQWVFHDSMINFRNRMTDSTFKGWVADYINLVNSIKNNSKEQLIKKKYEEEQAIHQKYSELLS